jgi:methylenetetrahydrofolate--tRNA-(uracil-5-)-methyltransferase
VELAHRVLGQPPVNFPRETALGALAHYISDPTVVDFQPMNVNFGIIPRLDHKVRGGKKMKNAALAERALNALATLTL